MNAIACLLLSAKRVAQYPRHATLMNTAANEISHLEAQVKKLQQECVQKEERFISCVSHLEGPHHCEITEPGNYIFLLKVFPNGDSVTMFKKTVPDTSPDAPYPCREWREFREGKPAWPNIPFKDYDEMKSAMKENQK